MKKSKIRTIPRAYSVWVVMMDKYLSSPNLEDGLRIVIRACLPEDADVVEAWVKARKEAKRVWREPYGWTPDKAKFKSLLPENTHVSHLIVTKSHTSLENRN